MSKKAKDKRDLPARIPKQLASNKIPFTKKRGERNTKVQPKMDKNQTRFFIYFFVVAKLSDSSLIVGLVIIDIVKAT